MARIAKNLPSLPIERALKVIAGRGKAVILYYLLRQSRRLIELEALMPGLRQKVLIEQLRELEAHGLVHREVQLGAPRLVRYRATDLGLSLEPVLYALCAWGQAHAEELGERELVEECIVRPTHAEAAERL
jgi:DNA-binding HxlR family transcriptional regulator